MVRRRHRAHSIRTLGGPRISDQVKLLRKFQNQSLCGGSEPRKSEWNNAVSLPRRCVPEAPNVKVSSFVGYVQLSTKLILAMEHGDWNTTPLKAMVVRISSQHDVTQQDEGGFVTVKSAGL